MSEGTEESNTQLESLDPGVVKELCQDYAQFTRVNISEEHGLLFPTSPRYGGHFFQMEKQKYSKWLFGSTQLYPGSAPEVAPGGTHRSRRRRCRAPLRPCGRCDRRRLSLRTWRPCGRRRVRLGRPEPVQRQLDRRGQRDALLGPDAFLLGLVGDVLGQLLPASRLMGIIGLIADPFHDSWIMEHGMDRR